MSTSQATLLKDFYREYALGRAGTATSATATTLVDASNFGFGPGGEFPTDSPIRVTSGAGVGSNVFKSKVDPSTGTITFQPSTSSINATTPTFVISNVIDHTDRAIEALNRSLTRKCSRRHKVPLTNIPDGDFLGALTGGVVTDHWTAGGGSSSAGLAYSNFSFPDVNSMRGIAVTANSSANGYAQCDNIPVHPATTRNFMCTMDTSATSTTGEFILRDITNTAVITPTYTIGAATSTSRSFVIVQGNYTVPAGCTQIAWRLNVQESGKTVKFGPLWDVEAGQTTFATQPHLNVNDDIGEFVVVSVRETGSIANPGPDTFAYQSFIPDGMKMDDFGWGYGMQFPTAPPFPAMYEEYMFYPALTSDTDTTDAPEPLVLCGAAMELYQMLGFGSTEQPIVSRGKIIPTLTLLKLQHAQELWRGAYMSRLRADRVIRMKRKFNAQVVA